LEETNSDPSDIREIYERAIAQVPDVSDKRFWRRYIFLWIRYAVYEELVTEDIERARQIYQQCIAVVPHKQFTFAKIWLLYAKFEIRQADVAKARKILGQGLGRAGKPRLYRGYIELEIKLKEFDRVRKLYEKFLESYPDLPQPWIDFATVEQELGDEERARAIYELAIAQPEMETPELVWRRYIEFETDIGEYDKARALYEKLLDNASHVKVWIAYAMFEASVPDEDEPDDEDDNDQISEGAKLRARAVFQRAWDYFKEQRMKEERAELNNAWLQFEQTYGDELSREKVEKQAPNLVKRRRRLDDGTFEEYYDYSFPTDERNMAKLLERAHRWREQHAASS
jgi:crooked neck